MTLNTLKNSSFITLQKIFVCGLVGIFAGSASACFLVALEYVTQIRQANIWILSLLPLGGFLIGLLYYYYGKEVVKGNNLILEAYQTPQQIPFRMMPLVLVTTLITHLFGGSAGREGTAVQMGVAISEKIRHLFKYNVMKQRSLLVLGISAGFASVFGTPIAGAIFAIELVGFDKKSFRMIIYSFFTAYIAHFVVRIWSVQHTHYPILVVPALSLTTIFWSCLAGVLFGLAAMLFSRLGHYWQGLFAKYIAYPPFRPFVGGSILAVLFLTLPLSEYIGIGVPTIVAAFLVSNAWYVFLPKILCFAVH
jgi:H+/Cl- antiporter ClcA